MFGLQYISRVRSSVCIARFIMILMMHLCFQSCPSKIHARVSRVGDTFFELDGVSFAQACVRQTNLVTPVIHKSMLKLIRRENTFGKT